MIERKYINEIKKIIEQFSKGKKWQFFIFGSSLVEEKIGDVDLGVIGNIKDEELVVLKEKFSDSIFPYFVDLVNFNSVSKKFKDNVFNNKILWIKH